MKTENEESYQILGWIIQRAIKGFYTLIASPKMQEFVISHYKDLNIIIYDYREHEKHFHFDEISNWVRKNPNAGVYVLLNFQLALRTEEDIWRLNAERDLLAHIEKSLLFCMTEGKERELRKIAIDFCSFIREELCFIGR